MQTLIVCRFSQKNCLLKIKGWDFCSGVLPGTIECILQYNTICRLSNFVDMSSKTTHTEGSFGYSYCVARPRFMNNQSLGIDCALSN